MKKKSVEDVSTSEVKFEEFPLNQLARSVAQALSDNLGFFDGARHYE